MRFGRLGAGFGGKGNKTGGGGGSSGPLAISFIDTAVDTAGQAAYTFTAQPLGTAAADRKIVLGIGNRISNGPTIVSVTIGGVSAASVVEVTSGNLNRAALWMAAVPTGTTGDVVVTFSGGTDRCGIAIWRITGSASLSAASDTDSGNTNETEVAVTLTVPEGGVAVAYSVCADAATPRTVTWTGLTEDFDEAIETTVPHSGAHEAIPAGGDTAMTCTYSAAPSLGGCAVFAAFGP